VLCEDRELTYQMNDCIYSLFSHVDSSAAWFLRRRDKSNDNVGRHAGMYVSACGRMGFECFNFVKVLEEQMTWIAEVAKPGDVGSVAWGCGKMGIGGEAVEWLGRRGREGFKSRILRDGVVREALITVWR